MQYTCKTYGTLVKKIYIPEASCSTLKVCDTPLTATGHDSAQHLQNTMYLYVYGRRTQTPQLTYVHMYSTVNKCKGTPRNTNVYGVSALENSEISRKIIY